MKFVLFNMPDDEALARKYFTSPESVHFTSRFFTCAVSPEVEARRATSHNDLTPLVTEFHDAPYICLGDVMNHGFTVQAAVLHGVECWVLHTDADDASDLLADALASWENEYLFKGSLLAEYFGFHSLPSHVLLIKLFEVV